jgi:hypothetical protein
VVDTDRWGIHGDQRAGTGDTTMGTTKTTGRRSGKDGALKVPAKKTRDVVLTLRMTRAERKRIRGYAVECELNVNELILREMAIAMDGWYTARRGDGPRLATATVPGSESAQVGATAG